MTPDKINKAVAEKIMGACWHENYAYIEATNDDRIPSWICKDCDDFLGFAQFSNTEKPDIHHTGYSTNIQAAWQVVEKMRDNGWWVDMYCDPTGTALWWFGFSIGSGPSIKYRKANHTLAPMAICLAALKAIE